MLEKTLKAIQLPCKNSAEILSLRIDQLIKPQGSLGKLEDLAIQVGAIQRTEKPSVKNTAIIVMCADHGVTEEGIASAPREITLAQALNMTKGLTGVAALARENGSQLYTVDVGIDTAEKYSGLIHKKIRMATGNMVYGPAMTKAECIQAIEVGIEMAHYAIDCGADLIGTGEMGIGNTTASTAILCALTGKPAHELTGIGANFPIEKLPHKAAVIEKALKTNHPNPQDPLDVLTKVGGLEIAGMTGLIIGGASKNTPVVIDGYISTVAALIACKLQPKIKDYIIGSHRSLEKSASFATELLGITTYLDMNFRLGEGSGAVLAFNLVKSACAMNEHMITFEEAGFGVV